MQVHLSENYIPMVVKIARSRLIFFLFFYFYFIFIFYFFIFRTLGLGLETLVTAGGVVTILITGYERKE